MEPIRSSINQYLLRCGFRIACCCFLFPATFFPGTLLVVVAAFRRVPRSFLCWIVAAVEARRPAPRIILCRGSFVCSALCMPTTTELIHVLVRVGPTLVVAALP